MPNRQQASPGKDPHPAPKRHSAQELALLLFLSSASALALRLPDQCRHRPEEILGQAFAVPSFFKLTFY